jgi:hypothetical protein
MLLQYLRGIYCDFTCKIYIVILPRAHQHIYPYLMQLNLIVAKKIGHTSNEN